MNPYREPGEASELNEEIDWGQRPPLNVRSQAPPMPDLSRLVPPPPKGWTIEVMSREDDLGLHRFFWLMAERDWGFKPREVRTAGFVVDLRLVALNRHAFLDAFVRAARLAHREMFPLLPLVRFGRNQRRLALPRGK